MISPLDYIADTMLSYVNVSLKAVSRKSRVGVNEKTLIKANQPPVVPQDWGNLKKIGDTPKTPAGEKSPAPLF